MDREISGTPRIVVFARATDRLGRASREIEASQRFDRILLKQMKGEGE
jgi:hypothetical protein